MRHSLSEGFFPQTQQINTRNQIINKQAYKDKLIIKLKRLEEISEEEWDFINTNLDEVIPVDNEILYSLCPVVIKTYGPNVSLNWIDTSGVTDMSYMFYQFNPELSLFDGDISKWDTSHVTNMQCMFQNCEMFNGDISKWDVSHVSNMDMTFADCKKFNADISKWFTKNAKTMNYMFCGCNVFNKDLSEWDVSNVECMSCMFAHCYQFNQDISSWDVSNVKDMYGMFKCCKNFNQNLSMWNIKNLDRSDDMFSHSGMEINNIPIK